jgi:hypothetical protein
MRALLACLLLTTSTAVADSDTDRLVTDANVCHAHVLEAVRRAETLEPGNWRQEACSRSDLEWAKLLIAEHPRADCRDKRVRALLLCAFRQDCRDDDVRRLALDVGPPQSTEANTEILDCWQARLAAVPLPRPVVLQASLADLAAVKLWNKRRDPTPAERKQLVHEAVVCRARSLVQLLERDPTPDAGRITRAKELSAPHEKVDCQSVTVKRLDGCRRGGVCSGDLEKAEQEVEIETP